MKSVVLPAVLMLALFMAPAELSSDAAADFLIDSRAQLIPACQDCTAGRRGILCGPSAAGKMLRSTEPGPLIRMRQRSTSAPNTDPIKGGENQHVPCRPLTDAKRKPIVDARIWQVIVFARLARSQSAGSGRPDYLSADRRICKGLRMCTQIAPRRPSASR